MLEFLTISGFIMLSAISPGADFALVVRNSLTCSPATARFTALGIGASLIVHTSYSLLGLAVVIANSSMAFSIVKFLGAAYLCWLGIRTLRDKSDHVHSPNGPVIREIAPGKAFKQGLFCNLLNPKAPLFFIAFYSVIIPASSGMTIRIMYGIESIILITVWFLFLASAISHHRIKSGLTRLHRPITKILGGALIFFGIRLAMLQD